jgi:hypothetical protein
MKKAAWVLALMAVVGFVVTGCATGSKVKPEELVMQQTQGFANDFVAGNADKLLGYVSDSFTNEHVASKAEIAEQIKKAKDDGKVAEYTQMIKDHHGKIDLAQAKVVLKNDTATVYPILASADEGEVTVELTFKKDADKVWRIAGINIEGI